MDLRSASDLADSRMSEWARDREVPAIAYGLVLGGELVHVGAAGSLASDRASIAPFRIASMTKSFTAATVLGLRDEERLSLDARVDEILPWAGSLGLPAASPPVRVHHLLTMTAGFPTDDPWGDRQESLALEDFDALVAGGLTFCRPPGMEFEYANIGYALLGRVIAQVTGRDYRDAVRERLLDPLGMASSTFDATSTADRVIGMHPVAAGLVEQAEGPAGAFSPMGGLWSTIGDLARWIGFLEGAWSESDDGPLSRWSRREMQRPHIVVGRESDDVIDSYGLGLRIADHRTLGRFVHHSGGYPGFGSHMRWHPDTRWGIVALGNRTYAPMRPVCAQILEQIVQDEAPEAKRLRAIDRMWPQTERAMDLVESLLVQWDDAALDSAAAINLDLDQPRAERREAWGARRVGSLTRDASSIASSSPAHARWTIATDAGDLQLDVLLTGEREPRIQAMAVRSADDPPFPG